MKVAVTYEKGMVFQHFGKCQNFLIAEVKDGKLVHRALLNAGGNGHSALVTLLQREGVNTLVCGGIGGGARTALQAAGISLISGAKGSVDIVLDAYCAGTLVDDPSGACHHHHEGGDHHCGESDHCH